MSARNPMRVSFCNVQNHNVFTILSAMRFVPLLVYPEIFVPLPDIRFHRRFWNFPATPLRPVVHGRWSAQRAWQHRFCIVKDCLALTVGIRADCGCFLLGIAQHLLGSLFGLLDFAEYI